MSSISMASLIFGTMLLLMALRVPIAIAMLGAGTLGYVAQAGWSPFANFLNSLAYARFSNYDLSVIPLFILMGQLATKGGISKSLFDFGATVFGRFQGGLAMAAVVASGAFGAICGSSVATAATITGVALPEMKRLGYSGRLSTGALAAGGTLGILIPPSVPLVIYAILTEQNIAKLFAAAMIPGIIAMMGYLLAIAIFVRVAPGHAPALGQSGLPHTDQRILSWKGWLAISPIGAIFALVFGGIYGGFFTPNEGACVGCAATLMVAWVKRQLSWKKLKHSFFATAESSAMIFLIFIGADVMNASLALTQTPAVLANWVGQWDLPPLLLVGCMLLFYVVLGSVMDELSMLMLTIPIFFPMVMGLDLGLSAENTAIWFGIMVLMTVGFGMLAPPVGLNVYVVNGMSSDVPMAESYKGVLPFLISDTVRVLFLLFFPAISLFLVQYIR